MFEERVNALRQAYSKIGSSARIDDFTVNKTVFIHLDAVRESVCSANEKSFSNSNLATLEDIVSGTNLSLVRSTILNVVAIYTAIVKKAPGYVIRNVLNSMIAVCNSKTASNASRECAVQVIGAIMINKPNDCANQITEAVQLLGRLVRLSDLPLKIACVKAVAGIVSGSGAKIGDMHQEILKLAVRLSADKSVEIRTGVADILRLLALHSQGLTTVPMDTLLPPAARGLEDETAVVQDAYASAVAAIFSEQVGAYLQSQEQAKVGAARGGTSAKTPKKPAPLSQRMSITKLTLTTKKIVEEWDFKSTVTYVLKQLSLGSQNLRTGYLTVLGHLVRTLLPSLTPEEYEWLVLAVIEVLRDSPAVRELTYEEQAFLRYRFSHFLRASITATATEPQLLAYAALLVKHISTVESSAHSDTELQLVLAEVNHAVGILGPACTALVEEVNISASIYLRHSNFGVRAAAAQLLGNIAVNVPAIATEFLRSALLNAQSQVKQLLQFDPIELTPDPEPTGVPMSEAEQQQALALARRRNSKEQERLQRIYFFHGHALVMSVLLKNATALPSGLPAALVEDAFALGIELLQQDVMSVPPIVRHVVCSVVRAGSLIVASCISMGYAAAHAHIPQLLHTCSSIFQAATTPSSPSTQGTQPPLLTHSTSSGSVGNGAGVGAGAAKTDELVYEVMCVESALVCVSTILRFCPEALTTVSNDEGSDCLGVVVDGLELAFKALRSKYQPRLRTHFRFRTLHAMMLESFALLPAGSFPQSCQSIFVEALRVFRDGVAAGYETTLLGNYLSDQYGVVSVGAGQAGASNISAAFQAHQFEAPMTEHHLMMRLETHATALQKKENEAFLSVFAAPAQSACVLSLVSAVEAGPDSAAGAIAAPCGNIDARTIDAAIVLLGVTFSHQSVEYQDKAVQLCAQALVQFAKASSGKSSMGIFSSVSEDERRRKDKMNYATLRNVLATLSAIIHAYPVHSVDEEDVPWRAAVVTILYDMLAHSSYTIRSASAATLAVLSEKVRVTRVVETVSSKIRGLMLSSLEKKVIDANSALDNAGYLVALSALWRAAAGLPDVESLITTTVFDSLRKVTSSLPFRAQGLLTLSVFVEDYLHRPRDNDAVDALDLLEKIVNVVDAHIANVNFSTAAAAVSICADELELFAVCLQRLVVVCCALSLRLYNLGVLDADRLHMRFNSIRTGVYNDSTSAAVRNETLSYFTYIVPVDTTGRYTDALLAFLKAVLRHSDDYSLSALNSAIVAVQPLLKQHFSAACKMGLESELFVLLNNLCARSGAAHASACSGIETRKGALLEEGDGEILRSCLGQVANCLYTLCAEDVRSSPDTRMLHWLLLGRCVALNTRAAGRVADTDGDATPGGAGGDDGEREEGEGFEEGGGHDAKGDFGVDAGSSRLGVYPLAAMNCTQFATYCRDDALNRAPVLDHARVQLKCVAVRCVLIALAHIVDNPLHFDLARARAETERHLHALKGKFTSPESLATVPRYLALFITDTVNLACACATYLIDEKPVLLLQAEAMKLLHQVISLFLLAEDPDTKMTQDASAGLDALTAQVEARLLHQFTSQLISAVRNALANTALLYSPELLHHAGMLQCDLIRGGFITDKIVLRRLVKLVVSYCEQGGNITPAAAADSVAAPTEALPVQAPQSPTVSANRAAVLHVVYAAILAELFAIGNSTDAQKTKFIAPAVKSAVASMVQEHQPVLTPLWFALVVDGARILWYRDTSAVPSKRAEGRQLDALFGNAADSGFTTPSSTEETIRAFHPLRGGLTYSAAAAVGTSVTASLHPELQEHLLASVPPTTAAYILSYATPVKTSTSAKAQSSPPSAAPALPAVPPTQVLPLFAVAHSSLRSLLATPGAIDAGALDHLLSSLLVLAAKDAPSSDAGDATHQYVIPLTEYTAMFETMANRILRSGASQAGSSRSVLELLGVVAERVAATRVVRGPHADVNACWLALWRLTNLLLHKLEPRLLPTFDESTWLAESAVRIPSLGTAGTLVEVSAAPFSEQVVALVKALTALASAVGGAVWAYTYHVLSLLLILSAAQEDRVSTGRIVSTLAQSDGATASALCAQLMVNLHDWVVAYTAQGAGGKEEVSRRVAEVSLTTWCAVYSRTNNADLAPTLFPVCALILNPTSRAVCTVALHAVLALLQSSASTVVAGQVLPALLTRLSYTGDATEIRSLLIKALLVLFALAPPEQKSALIEVFLTPMCAKICEHQTDAEFLLVCGRSVTHLARLEPDAFRAQVPALSEKHRTVLQGVMKLALQQGDDNASGVHSGAATSASGPAAQGGMTINMSKYKK